MGIGQCDFNVSQSQGGQTLLLRWGLLGLWGLGLGLENCHSVIV